MPYLLKSVGRMYINVLLSDKAWGVTGNEGEEILGINRLQVVKEH